MLSLRQQAYQQTFNLENQFVQRVLADLAKFCRADDSTFHIDSRMHALIEGRREVWLRIISHIKNSPDEIWQIYGGIKNE